MNPRQKKRFDSLSREEKKIFNAVMNNFPASSFDSAYNVAIMHGIKFQFTPT